MAKSEYAQITSTYGDSSCDLLESHPDPREKNHHRRLRLKLVSAFLFGVSFGVVAALISQYLFHSSPPTPPTSKPIIKNPHPKFPPPHPKNTPTYNVNANRGFTINPQTGESKCGNTWQEAKALNCHYDVLASRWYPPSCHNPAVLETMLQEVNFQWYADAQHTKPVSWELARSGEFDALYPLHDYHIMHCLYLWRRLHAALVGHLYLDDDVYAYGHTVHCTRLIMRWPLEWRYGKNTTTVSPSGRPFCRNEPL
ncbi:hypothetical protein Vi05172_g8791 [Venturia inaequalis]|nr:hypothetical protein Vi05172_g8791 [Venturia inaequalis]